MGIGWVKWSMQNPEYLEMDVNAVRSDNDPIELLKIDYFLIYQSIFICQSTLKKF